MIIPLHIEISDLLYNCESRLTSTINATDTSLSVTSGDGAARFPSYNPLLILIESEIVKRTAVSTDTFTIVRGERDTTAASHTSGTPLRAIEFSQDIKRIHGFLSEKTAAYTATSSDNTILVDGDVKITLPAVADSTNFGYIIKNVGTGAVTIDANLSETIDGETEIVLSLQYQFVSIVCDGTEWFITGGVYVKMEELVQKTNDALNEIIELLKQAEAHLQNLED